MVPIVSWHYNNCNNNNSNNNNSNNTINGWANTAKESYKCKKCLTLKAGFTEY